MPGLMRWPPSGMNRASIGVQDFDPLIQKAIGRDQSYEVTRDVADALRARGVASLNADILYGLPHQTRPAHRRFGAETADPVARPGGALRLCPCPVDEPAAADDPLRRDAHAGGTPGAVRDRAQLFLWDGYEEIGIDHFARPMTGWPARALRRARCAATSRAIPTTRPGADRAWRLVDLALSAGLCAERLGHGRTHQGDPRRAVPDPSRAMSFRRGPAARPDHRGADVRLPSRAPSCCATST
jgi:hypothetical protein